LVLHNGLIYDGTGRVPFKGDIAIEEGRIIAIRNASRAGDTAKAIDVSGLAIAPGFIDVHTHAENITHHPKAENFLRMGVTTLILGNCGSSKLKLGVFFKKLEQSGFRLMSAASSVTGPSASKSWEEPFGDHQQQVS